MDFEINFNNYILKITALINNFQLNVVIANVYSIYNLFSDHIDKEVSNQCLKNNFSNLMKILIPFTPHLAYECLDLLGQKEINKWPEVRNELNINEIIKIAVQINGKTREIIEVKKDLDEKNVIDESRKYKKISTNLENKKIIKIIFVKNRIINYLIK